VTNRLSSCTGLNVCEREQGAEEKVLGKAGKEERAVGQFCITNSLRSSADVIRRRVMGWTDM